MIALVLHPFYRVPPDLIPALEDDEYQAYGGGEGLEIVRWDEILATLNLKSLAEIGRGLMNFVFKGIEVPKRPELLAKITTLRAQGVLLPTSHGIPRGVAERIQTVIVNNFKQALLDPSDSMIISSPNGEFIGVCLADQFFTYVAGPEKCIAQILTDECLEVSAISADTPLTWWYDEAT